MPDPGKTQVLSRGGLLIGTRAGVIQYSAVPETIKDTMLLVSGVPSIYVIPPAMFSNERGISLAELEFPAYYNFFLKQRKIQVVCRPVQRKKLIKILSRSLFGPEQLSEKEFVGGSISSAQLRAELEFFTKNPFRPDRKLALEDLVEILEYDGSGTARLGESTRLVLEDDGGLTVVDGSRRKLRIPAAPPLPPMVLESDSQVVRFHRPVLGVSVIGSGHGFDAGNRTSGFIVWLDGQGVMVDPPVDSTEWLKGYDVPPKQVDQLILTHCHADHDAGTLQKILQEGRTTLYTTPTILDNFVSKYSALTGMSEPHFRSLFDFIPVRTDEPVFLNGAEVVFRYSFHSIPCIGFELQKGGRSLVYPSDTLNHPPTIQALHEKGLFSDARRKQLVEFPWNHTLVLHEAGIPPIHTPIDYLDSLPEDVKKRMFLVHVSSKQLVKTTDLRVAPTGLENTIDLKASRDRLEHPIQMLEVMSRVDIFSELPLSRAPEFLRMIRRVHFRAGERILAEGEVGDRFFIIVSGRASIVRGGTELKVYSEYDYFGETALILRQPRNADVVARTDVELLSLDHADFLHLIRGTDLIGRLTRLADARSLPTWTMLVDCPQLGNPTTNQLTQIQSLMEPLEAPEGPIPRGSVLILAEGRIHASLDGEVIRSFGSGDIVGDVLALMTKRRSPFSFLATGPVRGYSLRRAGFRKFLYKNPGIYLMLRSLLPTTTHARDKV